jgi:hypothetical protein
VNRKADILQELKELNSPLADMPLQMPFAVPDGYFHALAGVLAEDVRLFEMDDPAMQDLPKVLPYTTPKAYFEGLAEQLQRGATGDLKEGIAAPHQVPAAYFENLPAALTAVAKAAHPATKVISFTPAWRRIGRIAAAAVVILGLGIGTYSYFHAKTPDAIAKKQLSKLDQEVISTYVEQHVDEFDAETLETVAAGAHADAHAAISTLESSEIQEYLQEMGETAPAATDRETL